MEPLHVDGVSGPKLHLMLADLLDFIPLELIDLIKSYVESSFQYLFSCSADHDIRMWALDVRECLASLALSAEPQAKCLAVSQESGCIAVGASDGSIRLLHVTDDHRRLVLDRTLSGHRN